MKGLTPLIFINIPSPLRLYSSSKLPSFPPPPQGSLLPNPLSRPLVTPEAEPTPTSRGTTVIPMPQSTVLVSVGGDWLFIIYQERKKTWGGGVIAIFDGERKFVKKTLRQLI